MSVAVNHRRDTKTNIDSVTPAIAEIGMDITRKKFRFGDGAQQGGFRLQRENWRDSAPFTLSANTNDWAPAAFEELGLLLVNATAAINLTGLAGGSVGRDIEIRNEATSAGNLTIAHQSLSSIAANRFNIPTGKSIVLKPGQSAIASYDAVNSRWLCKTVSAAQIAVAPVGVQQNPDVQAVIDALANQLPQIIARSITAPPSAPANGDQYIVPAGATGDWTAQTDKIATWAATATPAAWQFTIPKTNQYVLSAEDQRLLVYSGGWVLPRTNFYLSNDVTPAQIAADAIDYNPAGLYKANVVRFSTDQAGRKITGIAGGDAGQFKVFLNIGSFPAIFSTDDTASTAANRISLGMNITVRPGESVTLRYDGNVNRWTMVARGVLTYNEFQGEVFMTGAISPTLSVDQNNWSPAGIASANTVYLGLTANVNITGMAGSTEGREISFFNTTAFTATFKEQSASSTAANRFAFGGDLLVPPNTSVTFRYVGATSRWVIKSAPNTIQLAAQVAALTTLTTQQTSDIAARAPLASPALTGVPTAPTAALGTNTTQIATMAAVQAAITALIGGAPGSLDTLKELADAINDDASYAAAVTAALALKAPLASPALTGTPTAPTAAVDTNTTQIATTAMVLGQAASATPNIGATNGAAGSSTRFARADHVHPQAQIITDLAAIAGVRGDIVYRGATGWQKLAAGTSGQFLQTLGNTADPSWVTLPGGGDMQNADNLSHLTDTVAALGNLGGTTVGKALFTSVSAAAARTTIGLGDINTRGADIASAANLNLEAATGNLVDVTGTVAVTAITLADGRERTVRFTGALVLTNGASLILPGGANITTAAGDFAVFRGYASGVVRCVDYTSISGKAVKETFSTAATKAEQKAASSTTVAVTPSQQQSHPSSPKAWVRFNGSGGVIAAYNVSGVTRTGAGAYTVTFIVPFANTNYIGVVGNAELSNLGSQGVFTFIRPSLMTTGSAGVGCVNGSYNTYLDVVEAHVVFYGDQ